MILVFGIGSATDTYVRGLDLNSIVFASTYGDKPYEGKKVYSLDELENISSFDKVVICSVHVNEIAGSLIKKGFKKNILYFFDFQKNKEVSLDAISIDCVSQDRVLYCFYDLKNNLPCYDVTVFCILAELKRIELGMDKTHFIIVPSSSFKDDHEGYSIFYDREDYQWRIKNILIPNFQLIASCAGISHLSSRELLSEYLKSSSRFPDGYSPANPPPTLLTKMLAPYVDMGVRLPFLRPSKVVTSLVSSYLLSKLAGRKLLTISLREYNSDDGRNSCIKSWKKFIEYLDKDKYFIVIIRDTYNAFLEDIIPPGDNVDYFNVGSINFEFRVALYEQAFLNFCVNNGPSLSMNFIEGCRYLYFIKVDNANPAMSERLYKSQGVEIGENYFFRQNSYQRLVWGGDDYNNIVSSFEIIENDIDSSR